MKVCREPPLEGGLVQVVSSDSPCLEVPDSPVHVTVPKLTPGMGYCLV